MSPFGFSSAYPHSNPIVKMCVAAVISAAVISAFQRP